MSIQSCALIRSYFTCADKSNEHVNCKFILDGKRKESLLDKSHLAQRETLMKHDEEEANQRKERI